MESVYIGHVGDSRVYLIRNRCIKQLTKDHSYVQMLVDKQRGNLIFESIVRDELDCFKIQIIL